MNRISSIRWFLAPVAALAVLAGSPSSGHAEVAKKVKPTVVGTSASADGMMLRRESPATPWVPVKEKGELYAGNLVLGLSGATVLSKNKAVELILLSDLNGRSPLPIIESAVVFSPEPGDFDLNFRLNRGRVDLINHKEKGAARVQFLVHRDPWEVSLEEPGSHLVLMLFGRWPAGTSFTLKPEPKDVPNAYMVVLVMKGEVLLKHRGEAWRMHAPPGPAQIEWDNVSGADSTPRKLEELPDWAVGEQPTEHVQKVAELRQKFLELSRTKSVEAAVDAFLNSDDPLQRRFAVFAMGALDDVERLANTLATAKHEDVWDNGVLALRHYIGRGPGQDQRLYQKMIDKGVSPIDAEITVSLLHSFSREELAQPEVYQTLIAYLNHERLGIRGLAYWHLSRLVPEGKAFGYKPLDPKEKRLQAIKKWRRLIPRGELPPKDKGKEKEPPKKKLPGER